MSGDIPMIVAEMRKDAREWRGINPINNRTARQLERYANRLEALWQNAVDALSPAHKDPISAAVDAQLDPLKDELIAMGRRLAKGTRVELPSPKEPWPDPTLEMLEDPRFEAIWQRIKSWDINVPSVYGGYCGATGNHVRAILDALVEATR